MKAVHPYLNFDGNAEEAFQFYRSVFGGEFLGIARYRDMGGMSPGFPEDALDRVAHIALPLTEHTVLMASDVVPGFGNPFVRGTNCYISLEPGTREEAERLYAALSEGGQIEMPLGQTGWAELYASFTDRFGTCWMINYTGNAHFQPTTA